MDARLSGAEPQQPYGDQMEKEICIIVLQYSSTTDLLLHPAQGPQSTWR